MKAILTVSVVLLLALPAAAEWYVAGDMLYSDFATPKVDGTFKQDNIPGGSQFDGQSLAWAGGLGYRFRGDDRWLTQGWSLEGGYKRFGTVDVGGFWVSDDAYEHVNKHGLDWLDQHGITPKHYMLKDRMQGGYVRVAKTLYDFYGFEPYATVGMFAAHHELSKLTNESQVLFSGPMIGVTAGGGVKYALYQGIKIRGGVESHWTIAESQNPVSSQWTMVGGGIEVPLTIGFGSSTDYLWQR